METTAKHTPIHAGKDRFGAFLMIGDFRSAMPSIEVATQLAAAPELLKALEMALYYYESFRDKSPIGETETDDMAIIRAAIGKAKGE